MFNTPEVMKITRILLATLLLTALASFSAFKPADHAAEGPINWVGFDAAIEKMQKTGKPVLIDVYTDWCGWCKKMDADTYADPSVAKQINSDFIPVKFNPEKQGTYAWNGGKEKYTGRQLVAVLSDNQLRGYPGTIFLIPLGGNQLQKHFQPGYLKPDQMKSILKQITDSQKQYGGGK